jgi:hypothetical protein
MSELQISELNSTSLTVLNDRETSAVVGGGTVKSYNNNTQIGVNLSSIHQLATGGGWFSGGGKNKAFVGQHVSNSIS